MSKMKKISIITILLYMFFITSSFASTATIDVNSARLREDANTTSKVLTNIYKGEKVEILEKDGEWYKVKYGSNTGYLKNTLIKEDAISNEEKVNEKTDETVEDVQQEDSNKVVIKSNTVIRYQPNMISNTIVSVEIGKELTKELELGKWIKVSDGAIDGWILKAKIENQNIQKQDTTDSNKTNTTTEENTNTTNTVNTNKVNTNTVSNKVTNTVVENKVENKVVNEVKQETSNSTGNKKGKVNVETAKVRKEASTTAKIVGFLDYNDEITILAEEGEFYKFTEKSVSGYVHKSLITPIEENVSSRGNAEERVQENVVEDNKISKEEPKQEVSIESNNTSKGKEVAELALKYNGYKYVVGGKNPESGFDCSGFTRYIFLQFGYSLGNTAASQNNLGVEVERSALKEGDLILFYDEQKSKIGHTGIYISGGDFIHSANPERGVVIDNLNTNSYYNERYIVAKRIVE